MSVKEMKRLKMETGASFSECKLALSQTDSFEEAVVFVKTLIAKRQASERQAEIDREQKQDAIRAEKEKQRQRWSQFCAEFQHMSSKEMKVIFESCNLDWAETRRLATLENDKRSIEYAEQKIRDAELAAKQARKREEERRRRERPYEGWDVYDLLAELIAWLNDPYDLSGSGMGKGWKLFPFLEAPVPIDVGHVVKELHMDDNPNELNSIQKILQDYQNGVEGDYENILEYWSDKPIGDKDLVDAFVIGHSGIFSGLSELLKIVEEVDITRED